LSSTSTRSQANSDSNSILIVKIANPEKHGEGVDAHVRYELRTQVRIFCFKRRLDLKKTFFFFIPFFNN